VNCINLRERCGRRYKVVFEESYYAERPEFRVAEAAWLTIMPCQHGHICPWGGDRLAACGCLGCGWRRAWSDFGIGMTGRAWT